MTNSTQENLTWMLDDLVMIPDVVGALVLSTDGLVIQKSTTLPQDGAEIAAAAASSLYSVAAGMGRHFESGPVQQVIIEYGNRTLFIAAAGQNARLAVLCEQAVDMGTVAYEMGRLVTRIGEFLGTEARPAPLRPPSPSGTGHG